MLAIVCAGILVLEEGLAHSGPVPSDSICLANRFAQTCNHLFVLQQADAVTFTLTGECACKKTRFLHLAEKKRKDYTLRHEFDEKPSITHRCRAAQGLDLEPCPCYNN